MFLFMRIAGGSFNGKGVTFLLWHLRWDKQAATLWLLTFPGGRGVSVWLGLLLGREDERRGRAPGGGPKARGPGKIIIFYFYLFTNLHIIVKPWSKQAPKSNKSRIKRKKEGFGPWADTKITWATRARTLGSTTSSRRRLWIIPQF